MSYFHRVSAQTPTRFWINNVTREEAVMALENGATGCTQNPSYTYKMLVHSKNKDHAIELMHKLVKEIEDDTAVEVALQRQLVSEAAQEFLPQYEASKGQMGYVSIQGDPFDESYETIMKLARYNREAGPNIMIKIPATANGIKAIEQCIRENIPVNCTEVFAMQQVVEILDAYDRAVEGNPNPPVVYISHISGIFDEYLTKYAKANNVDISSDIIWHASKIVAQKVREYMDNRGTGVKLINGGARGLQHFTEWVGCDVANTINWIGTADKLVEQDGPVVCRFYAPIPAYVLDELCNKLPDFEKAYFTGRLASEEFEPFGPVELFCSSFRRDWKAALGMIAEARAAK